MEAKSIALIGAGELGSRHLQALAKCEFGVLLQVVDPNEAARQLSKRRYDEVPINTNVKKIEFFSTLDQLAPSQDLVIIATNSDIRLNVLRDLLNKISVKNILLEKIIFTSVEEVNEAEALLKQKNIRAFVNCPKRSLASYKFIKEKVSGATSLAYTVDGENWGLGCNAIHFLDVMSFLTNSEDYHLDTKRLDRSILSSKRKGFVEVSGELTARFSEQYVLRMSSQSGDKVSFLTKIETERVLIEFDERSGRMQIEDKQTRKTESHEFRPVFQSELTHILAKFILFGNEVEVPVYATSARLHRPLLKGLLDFYNHAEKKHDTRLLIT